MASKWVPRCRFRARCGLGPCGSSSDSAVVELGYNVFFGAIGAAFIGLCVFLGWRVLIGYVFPFWRAWLFLLGILVCCVAFYGLYATKGDHDAQWVLIGVLFFGLTLGAPFFWNVQKNDRAKKVWKQFDGVCPSCKTPIELYRGESLFENYRCGVRSCRLHFGEWSGGLPGEKRGPWWWKILWKKD